jgi:hypothetical protein
VEADACLRSCRPRSYGHQAKTHRRVSPIAGFAPRAVHDLTAHVTLPVDPDAFDAAMEESRAEWNLSRANAIDAELLARRVELLGPLSNGSATCVPDSAPWPHGGAGSGCERACWPYRRRW